MLFLAAFIWHESSQQQQDICPSVFATDFESFWWAAQQHESIVLAAWFCF